MTKFLLSILLPLNSIAQIVLTNGLTQEFQSSANGTVIGKIKIKNIGKKPETFTATKYEIVFECGKYGVFSETETHDRTLNNWLEFDVDEKVLSPNEDFDLVFRINIPDNTGSGTYWSAVMIESGDPLITGAGSELKVQNKTRYAVQLMVNLGSFEAPKMIYKNITITKNNNKGKIIKIELENAGFFAAVVKTQLEVYDEKGKKIQTVNGEIKRVYPSRCNISNIEVKNLPPGKYDGVVIADTGKKVYGSNVSIQIE